MFDSLIFLSEVEIAERVAQAAREFRLSRRGAHMTQQALADKAGVSVGTIKRFEKTGKIEFSNLVSIFKYLGLLDHIEAMIPEVPEISPMEALRIEQCKKKPKRVRRKDD